MMTIITIILEHKKVEKRGTNDLHYFITHKTITMLLYQQANLKKVTVVSTLHLLIWENLAVQSLKSEVIFVLFDQITARHGQRETDTGNTDSLSELSILE